MPLRADTQARTAKEFFAEMFTEYYRTGGQTPNLACSGYG
jgi:hypothetical protein